MKSNITTIAAANTIQYINNKTTTWLSNKIYEINFYVQQPKKQAKIYSSSQAKKIKEQAKILQYKIDSIDKQKMEAEIKEQKASDDREKLTKDMEKVGGLLGNVETLDVVSSVANAKEVANVLQNHIRFMKTVLC